jgi:hypothetical protein
VDHRVDEVLVDHRGFAAPAEDVAERRDVFMASRSPL